MIIPVILCGGSGTRLWPLSREGYPKQFLDLQKNGSMLVNTLRRLSGLPNLGTPLIVCGEAHRFLIAEQLREAGMGHANLLLEPVGRNTAPAVAIAALEAVKTDPQNTLLVLPADHLIHDQANFHQAIGRGLELLTEQFLVTFGVVPNKPETGYGYIKKGASLGSGSVFKIGQFVEKPDLETAQHYFQSGDYLWNSGMFLFKAKDWLAELEQLAPDILRSCQSAWQQSARETDFTRIDVESFTNCRSDSIDYAVMEKTAKGAVVPLDAGWNDLGTWDSVWESSAKDDRSNCLLGDVVAVNSSGSYFSANHRLLAVVGVKDLVVVETADAVLVLSKECTQDVKKIVDQLKKDGRTETRQHPKVFRPWGYYDSLESGCNFQVKRIAVNPGASLSLQKHHQRAEHWIVIKGTATITCDEKRFDLAENNACHIPLGSKHRLENQTESMVEIIEVQLGDYLGEDDIVRYEDIYGR